MTISPVLPVYKRSKLEIERGEGSYLYTKDGKKYLDFVTGVAVNCLGHCSAELVDALKEQAHKLWHVSNLYTIPGMQELANKLTKKTFADTVFFCNSGAEAIECLIKMVRKYHNVTGNTGKYKIITFSGAFHGRTLAAIWASKRDKLMQEGFGPPVEGFVNIPFGDIDAVKDAIIGETAGILVEPIQGDGGIRVPPAGFLKQLREICDEKKILLCFDEVQSGMGRSGRLFAHELYDVEPDIMASAKGIGGGFPLGACLATEKAAQGMTLGTHGSTYGGNALAMAVGNKVFDVISDPMFKVKVHEKGKRLKNGMLDLAMKFTDVIKEVRGEGLLLGLKVIPDNKEFIQKLEDNGLLNAAAGENVVRYLPPLNISDTEIDEALEKTAATCKEFA